MPGNKVAFAGIFYKETAAPLKEIGTNEVLDIVQDSRRARQIVNPTVGLVPHIDRTDRHAHRHERLEFVQTLLQSRHRNRIKHGQSLQVAPLVELVNFARHKASDRSTDR